MAAFFLDTSALFKLYLPEQGSEVIDQIFHETAPRLIANLTITELMSNISRLITVDKVLAEKAYRAVKADLLEKSTTNALQVINITTADVLTSIDLIAKRYISPVDALQLAAAIRLAESVENLTFVCADKKLCQLAGEEGLPTINPLDS